MSEQNEPMILSKMTLIITTRCNLKCRLCCEYVPQNKPFPDMTLEEEKRILDAFFVVVDHVKLLHLSGGGEPFIHPKLAEMVHLAFQYSDKFDRLMLFTNSTVPLSEELLACLKTYKDKIIIHASDYGMSPQRTEQLYATLRANDIPLRVVKYHGEDQDFGGWVDFGPYEARGRDKKTLEDVFENCAMTRIGGNWRTRDGTVHWCSRSQRGMELGLLPRQVASFVDLFDESQSRDEKQALFRQIAQAPYHAACDWCSGDQGTEDSQKRYPAAQQM